MTFFYFLMSIFNFSEVLFFWKRLYLMIHSCLWIWDPHVLMDICVCRYIMHVCAHGSRVQRVIFGIFLITLQIIFEGSISHWTWSSLTRLCWLIVELQGSAYLQNLSPHAFVFMGMCMAVRGWHQISSSITLHLIYWGRLSYLNPKLAN